MRGAATHLNVPLASAPLGRDFALSHLQTVVASTEGLRALYSTLLDRHVRNRRLDRRGTQRA